MLQNRHLLPSARALLRRPILSYSSYRFFIFRNRLARDGIWLKVEAVSAHEIIQEIKNLPPAERAQIATFLLHEDDSWIPDDFKAAMKDMEAGRLIDADTALHETPPPHLR